jgi:hypothetical protein
MIKNRVLTALFILASFTLGACELGEDDDDDDDDRPAAAAPAPNGGSSGGTSGGTSGGPTPTSERTGPGADATDKRTPKLGGDPTVVKTSKMTMAEGLAQAKGPAIESKFELDDSGKLSLSVYPVGKGITVDPENNEFQELFGDPTVVPWKTQLDIFKAGDFEHLTRSARDLTLVQISKVSLLDAVNTAAKDGIVYWAIPTIEKKRAGYGIYLLKGGTESVYRFIDGGGSSASTITSLKEIGDGPGAGATDTRKPKTMDLDVLATSKITMAAGLKQMEAKYGQMIEAKFEPNDDGKLSLSLYPVGKGITTDPENNEFQELQGEIASGTYEPKLDVFKADDFEHITRSTRDLTLVQTAGVTLAQAVDAAAAAVPGGFVYWAIPTIRDTRSGFGVYVYGADKKVHYFFVS